MRAFRLIGPVWLLALAILPGLVPESHASAAPPPRQAAPSAAEQALVAGLETFLSAHPELKKARVGVALMDVTSGRTLFSRRPDEAFNVASVTKLVTSAAALAMLGPEFRFRTTVWADRLEADGTVTGNLYLRGSGDPTLTAERLWKVVSDLKLAGVARVTGALVVDPGYFDRENLPPAFDQKTEDAAFRAPVSAVALNYSAVSVMVHPGRAGEPARVTVAPQSAYAVVTSSAVTVADGRTAVQVTAAPRGDRLGVQVSGTIRADGQPVRVLKRVEHAELFAGETLRAALGAYGIPVASPGVVVGTVPGGARLLATNVSDPLTVIVRDLNKFSNNFMAETLLKVLGAESAGAPGTWRKGVDAVTAYLAGVGLARGSYRYENGSGLYDSNRFTPVQLVKLLRHAYRDFRYAADFVAALAVAGADGTIRSRMQGGAAERYVRAKTGTLDGVSCLAGYAGSVGHSPVAFAILLNDVPKKPDAVRAARTLQDEIAQTLALYLDAPAP